MHAPEPGSEQQRAEGPLFATVRRLLATLLAIAQTRLELVTTELQEEMQRAATVVLWALLALFFASLGVLMLALTLLIVFWEEHRLLAAALICAGFLLAAMVLGLRARALLQARTGLLAGSLAELRRDREALERHP